MRKQRIASNNWRTKGYVKVGQNDLGHPILDWDIEGPRPMFLWVFRLLALVLMALTATAWVAPDVLWAILYRWKA